MNKVVFSLCVFSVLFFPISAKIKEPNAKEKIQLTEYIKQTFENETGFDRYYRAFGESYNDEKVAKYIYFEQDLDEEKILETNITEKMVYELDEIEFEKFEKLSVKSRDKLLNGNLENIDETVQKDILKNLSTNSFLADNVYSFFNVMLKFKNTANEEKVYFVENLFICYVQEKGYQPSKFHFLNTNWIAINIFDNSNKKIDKGWYLLDRDFLYSYAFMKQDIESAKPRGIEKELLDYYGTYKIYSTSYLFNGPDKRTSTNLDDVDLLYFDEMNFSYKLSKGYSSYIMDANESYIDYRRNSLSLESDLVRFIIEDKANVIVESKIEKNSFQSGSYYESVYKFDSNKTFMLKNTNKTQAVEMKIGSDRYYPIYETVLISNDSPLYGKKNEMKNYKHKAK